MPQKNKGMINPPRHPEVTVIAIAIILKINTAAKNWIDPSASNSSLISKWLKYRVRGI